MMMNRCTLAKQHYSFSAFVDIVYTQAGYGTIFSLVTHGFHTEAIIRLKANGTTAKALVLVGCVEFVFMPTFCY